jgi:hypothetical protein
MVSNVGDYFTPIKRSKKKPRNFLRKKTEGPKHIADKGSEGPTFEVMQSESTGSEPSEKYHEKPKEYFHPVDPSEFSSHTSDPPRKSPTKQTSSSGSPLSTSPEKPHDTIGLTGKVVYFCSVGATSKFQYTKIILENKSQNEFSYIIVRIINKPRRKVLLQCLDHLKKKIPIMLRINAAFMEESLQKESLNTFGESYMNKLTRTLKIKMKTYTTYTLDVSKYDSKRKLIVAIIDPPLNQRYNLHKLDAVQ